MSGSNPQGPAEACARPAGSGVFSERLAHLLVEVTDTLVDDFDEARFARMVTRRVADLLGAGQVGLMLVDDSDRLAFLAASDRYARVLQLVQLEHDDGPCLDAFRTAQRVTAVDLAAAHDRWPHFVRQASQAGFARVHAFPLRLRERVIGVMSVFGAAADTTVADTAATETAAAVADLAVVGPLADAVTIGILQRRALDRATLLSDQLQTALNSRVIIEQAKGVVAQALGMTPDEAFILIRRYARGNHQRLTDVADRIVSGLARPLDLTAP